MPVTAVAGLTGLRRTLCGQIIATTWPSAGHGAQVVSLDQASSVWKYSQKTGKELRPNPMAQGQLLSERNEGAPDASTSNSLRKPPPLHHRPLMAQAACPPRPFLHGTDDFRLC